MRLLNLRAAQDYRCDGATLRRQKIPERVSHIAPTTITIHLFFQLTLDPPRRIVEVISPSPKNDHTYVLLKFGHVQHLPPAPWYFHHPDGYFPPHSRHIRWKRYLQAADL